jgi:hypothetical protein
MKFIRTIPEWIEIDGERTFNPILDLTQIVHISCKDGLTNTSKKVYQIVFHPQKGSRTYWQYTSKDERDHAYEQLLTLTNCSTIIAADDFYRAAEKKESEEFKKSLQDAVMEGEATMPDDSLWRVEWETPKKYYVVKYGRQGWFIDHEKQGLKVFDTYEQANDFAEYITETTDDLVWLHIKDVSSGKIEERKG